ncbi:MAG: hypothetical protein M0P61_14725 [Ignavibacteriaceae bacterium]|jgi:hypothetical protein|nr:hypothetical protein [Ignavibacteriaceae bacterium]
MMQITFDKDGGEIQLTTNNQMELDVCLQNNYKPIAMKFVPGDERIEPEPKDERITITPGFLIQSLREKRKGINLTPLIKLEVAKDPALIKWYAKFEQFRKFYDEELTLMLEEWKSKNERNYCD